MNKEEFIEAIANASGHTKVDTRKFLEAHNQVILEALSAGGSVQQVGFATYSVSKRAARKGRNPSTGAEINIAERNVVKFVAGKQLKESVNSSDDSKAKPKAAPKKK